MKHYRKLRMKNKRELERIKSRENSKKNWKDIIRSMVQLIPHNIITIKYIDLKFNINDFERIISNYSISSNVIN